MIPFRQTRITLLTDFGTADGFVGAMKGVMAGIAPGVLLDDVSHDLPAGGIRAGARALTRYWDRYPPGTVHLVVVDPGVGTDRRPLAVESGGRFFVGPDNGLATPMLSMPGWRAVSLASPAFLGPDRSATFHGRDVFAPAAAHLARGVALELLGPPVPDPIRLDSPRPKGRPGEAVGVVLAIDRFGNLLTNVPASWCPAGCRIRVAGEEIPLVHTYGSVEPGALLALANSDGMLEVAVRDGSAARRLGVMEGAEVQVGEER